MIKSRQILLLSLILSSQQPLAGELGPVESRGWEIGGHALYLQSYIGNNGVAFAESSGETIPPYSTTLGPNLNYGWGFELEAGYHLNQQNDINVNWYDVHYSQSTNQYVNSPGDWVGPVGIHVSELIQSGPVLTRIKPNWDAVNVEFGHSSSFDAFKSWRIHAGVEYSRIQTKTVYNGTLLSESGGVAAYKTSNTSSTYNGFGPRVGVDLMHKLYKKSNVYAKVAGAVLAGSNQHDANLTNYSTNNYDYKKISSMMVVPEVDAKLGVNYAYSLQQGELVVDIGWLWVNYFDVVRAPSATPSLGNFGEQGLFFGLQWHGNFA